MSLLLTPLAGIALVVLIATLIPIYFPSLNLPLPIRPSSIALPAPIRLPSIDLSVPIIALAASPTPSPTLSPTPTTTPTPTSLPPTNTPTRTPKPTRTPTPTLTPTPSEVIVDDADSGFSKGGSFWQEASAGYRGHMFWTYVHGDTEDCWAEWRPDLPACGFYEISAFVPPGTTTTNALYEIHHRYGVMGVSINQRAHAGTWVRLESYLSETYQFAAGTRGYVRLTDATGELIGAKIGFDAIRWVFNRGCETLTPVPTATPKAKATPLPPTRKPPPAPTDTPAPTLPAPILIAPVDEREFTGRNTPIVLKWWPKEELGENEWYSVDLRYYGRDGNRLGAGTWTKETEWQVPASLFDTINLHERAFEWDVTIIRHTGTKPDGTKEWTRLSPTTESRIFYWR